MPQRIAEAPTRRLFIGLFPEAAVRDAVVAFRQRWAWPADSRPTPPARLHLTLHFLGEVEAAREAALRVALAEVRLPPLQLLLCRAEVWRNGIAALLPDEHRGLRAWHADLAAALARSGLDAPPGRWRPHLTLARRAAGASPPEPPAAIPWTVTEYALVWSRLAPSSQYVTLEIYST